MIQNACPNNHRILFNSISPFLCSAIFLIVGVFAGNDAKGQGFQLTSNNQDEYQFSWYPNGEFILATSLVNGGIELWNYTVPGGAGERISCQNLQGDFYSTTIPFSDSVLFDAYDPVNGGPRIWIVHHQGGACRKFLNYPATMPAVSPDGQWLAYGWNDEIYVVPMAGGNPVQITSGLGQKIHPAWSPDGSKLAYVTESGQNFDLWLISSMGGTATQLTIYPGYDDHPCWISESEILFDTDRGGNWDIYKININTQAITLFLDEPDRVCFPALSPNGEKLAYVSSMSGKSEIWIRDLTTGITRSSGAYQRLQLFPNPAADSMIMRFTATQAANGTMMIFDNRGMLIFETTIRIVQGKNAIKISLEKVKLSGTFLVTVKGINQDWIEKLVIVNE